MRARSKNKLERHELSYEENSKSYISCNSDDIVSIGGRYILCAADPTRLSREYNYDDKYVFNCEPGCGPSQDIY